MWETKQAERPALLCRYSKAQHPSRLLILMPFKLQSATPPGIHFKTGACI